MAHWGLNAQQLAGQTLAASMLPPLVSDTFLFAHPLVWQANICSPISAGPVSLGQTGHSWSSPAYALLLYQHTPFLKQHLHCSPSMGPIRILLHSLEMKQRNETANCFGKCVSWTLVVLHFIGLYMSELTFDIVYNFFSHNHSLSYMIFTDISMN